jgi:hypothetical protein
MERMADRSAKIIKVKLESRKQQREPAVAHPVDELSRLVDFFAPGFSLTRHTTIAR